MKKQYILIPILFIGFCLIYLAYQASPQPIEKVSGAAKALEMWHLARAYPHSNISMAKYTHAFEQKKLQEQLQYNNKSVGNEQEWEALGPKNIGGRTLCIAFNPQNPNTLYAGSASGGLWRSYTGGEGVQAWQRVPTGFPVLGVAAIAFAPNDSSTLYIGTGEVYITNDAAPGVVNRLTRGSYGIGILKSTDGGATWQPSLDWRQTDLRGVNKIVVNPLNNNVLYAATSIGLYKTTDAGNNWNLIHEVPLAMDVEIHPTDTNLVFVSYGNLNSEGKGIYRSQDSGQSFEKLTSNLPADFTGKVLLTLVPSNPNIIYASVGNNFASRGLYKSLNKGDFWLEINTVDVARWQGWYSHDVAIHPENPDTLIQVGIDVWKSTNGGESLSQKTDWFRWQFGQVPVGGPEGPGNYVHGDIHAAYYHPTESNTIYLTTDGGVFKSTDNGENFTGCNGGYQCTQFYANFSNSTTDSSLAIGGMQDNATALYIGDDAWVRILGGDGMSTAINPTNDNIIYGSSQNLNLSRSTNKGDSFVNIVPPDNFLPTSFVGPFELAPSNPQIVYAGRTALYKSENTGTTWTKIGDAIDGQNPILTMAIHPTNADIIYVSTASTGIPPANGAKVFKTEDGGANWTNISEDLPERLAMDIAIHPTEPEKLYVVFSGYGSAHLFVSENAGLNWEAIDNGLPDLPTNTILIDPIFPDHLYVGNDLGVYLSKDRGETWSVYSNKLPDATMVMHLSLSPSNRKLRVATHGSGVYQTAMAAPDSIKVSVENTNPANSMILGRNYPNPVENQMIIPFYLPELTNVKLSIFDSQGRLAKQVLQEEQLFGEQKIATDLTTLPSGVYYYTLVARSVASKQVFVDSKIFVKQ